MGGHVGFVPERSTITRFRLSYPITGFRNCRPKQNRFRKRTRKDGMAGLDGGGEGKEEEKDDEQEDDDEVLQFI